LGPTKFGAGIQYKISFHLFPQELELIMIAPDIVARPGNDVLTRLPEKTEVPSFTAVPTSLLPSNIPSSFG